MEKLKIHPIPLFKGVDKLGKPKMTYLHYFGEDVHVGCFTWYIEGADEKILVDTGGNADTNIARGRPKETVTHIQTLEEGLARYDLKPADIDIVIVTHLHWDHVELASKFVNARFVVQERELIAARDPEAEGYVQEYFEGLNFDVLNGDAQITGGVRVMLTPGHSSGGQSVAVETEKGVAVIAGFCCIEENFKPGEEIKKKTPFIVPGIHDSVTECKNSMQRIIEVADIIVPLHDPKYADITVIP